MSWVCDVILLCGRELYPDNGEKRDRPQAIVGINAWLRANNWAPLVPLHDHIGMQSEKAFQACAYGAALNFLDVPAFVRVVGDEWWEDPGCLVLLLKNEEETRFTVYRMAEGG